MSLTAAVTLAVARKSYEEFGHFLFGETDRHATLSWVVSMP